MKSFLPRIIAGLIFSLHLMTMLHAQPTFSEHPLATGWNSWCAVLFDIDNDGDSDIVASSRLTSRLGWWENDNLVFTFHDICSNADYAMGLAVGDLDQDNDADIVCAVQESDQVEWWENDGSQQFTRRTVGTLVSPNQVCLADLDNDNDLDIAASACEDGSNKIVWFENLGSQAFLLHIVKDNWDHANSVSAADMDYDGDIDLLATASFRTATSGGEISWFENMGNKQFLEHLVISDHYRPSNAVAADIDVDDDMDILATVCEVNQLELYRNDGNMVFTQETIATNLIRPHCIQIADLDNDTDPDILATAMDSREISWWENTEYAFTKHVITSSFNGATWINTGDIDLDGDLDILGTAQYANQIKWWENGLIIGIPEKKEDTDPLSITLYPNPFSDVITIHWIISGEKDWNVSVFDGAGKLIKILAEGKANHIPPAISWDGRNETGMKAPSGTYILTFTSGEQIVSKLMELLD